MADGIYTSKTLNTVPVNQLVADLRRKVATQEEVAVLHAFEVNRYHLTFADLTAFVALVQKYLVIPDPVPERDPYQLIPGYHS